jgi:hypothetical protein
VDISVRALDELPIDSAGERIYNISIVLETDMTGRSISNNAWGLLETISGSLQKL